MERIIVDMETIVEQLGISLEIFEAWKNKHLIPSQDFKQRQHGEPDSCPIRA